MGRPRRFVILLGAAAAAAAAVIRHCRGAATAHKAPGGILIGDAAAYDQMSRLLASSLFGRIAADAAAAAPAGARVLEVGCGPGRLSIRLARQHGLDVTGLDLDPAMIGRARANAARPGNGGVLGPTFVVGDVAALAFPDGSFDLVVSTLSMHHWADPAAALAEIGRVLRPGARALIWDFGPGARPFHPHLPDPVQHARGAPLRVASATPWRWPWRFSLTQRIELVRNGESA
jgi:SAM-dependent methyltransferase